MNVGMMSFRKRVSNLSNDRNREAEGAQTQVQRSSTRSVTDPDMKALVSFILIGMIMLAPQIFAEPNDNQYAYVDIAPSLGIDDIGKSTGAAWVDFDNDGDLDLYVANADSSNRLYRNDGGVFVDVASDLGIDVSGKTIGSAWGDFDNDGDMELFISNTDAPDRLFVNDLPEARGFTDVTQPMGIVDREPGGPAFWMDQDMDGDLDLYVSSSPSSALLRNDGSVFTEVSESSGLVYSEGEGFSWADFDGDGDLDLFCANYYKPKQLWRNDIVAFVDIAPDLALDDNGWGRGCPWGDYDNDGDLDLYLSENSAANRLYRNDEGSFTNVASSMGVDLGGDTQGATWLDYDNDGDIDLYVSTWTSQSNKLFPNDDLTFTDVTAEVFGTPNYNAERSGVVGDFDGDGFLDIYVCNHDGPNRLYHNTGGDNSWLTVQAVGKKSTVSSSQCESNANGIGAVIRVTTDDLTERMKCVGEGGTYYSSQNSLPVEFGLGSNTTATVVVEWPSGAVNTIYDVAANQALVIEEHVCGDADGSCAIDIDDVVFLVAYIFIDGPAPSPLAAGDADCSGGIDIDDVVYLIDYIFSDGPEPCSGGQRGLEKIGMGSAELALFAAREGEATSLIVNVTSDREIQGVQLEIRLRGAYEGVSVLSLADGMQEFHSTSDGVLKIGLVDLYGVGRISKGENALVRIDLPDGVVATLERQILIAIGGERLNVTTKSLGVEAITPDEIILKQNYPNPFNPTTSITVSMKKAGEYSLTVYNVLGQIVDRIAGVASQPGEITLDWDGSGKASGIYLYRLDAGEYSDIKKMMLMK